MKQRFSVTVTRNKSHGITEFVKCLIMGLTIQFRFPKVTKV